MAENKGYAGQRDFTSGNGLFNALNFIVRNLTGNMATATVVQVVAVTNDDTDIAVGFVDVQLLVNQQDSQAVTQAHGVLHHLPYFRLQGGVNAIIMDPKVGDLGIAVFASRDISAVKSTKAQANPGSFRRYDYADGMYLGGILNGVPTRFVEFNDEDGIIITDPAIVTINAPLTLCTGDFHAEGAVIAGYGGADQVGLQTHTHTQGNDSHGDTEAAISPPTAGT